MISFRARPQFPQGKLFLFLLLLGFPPASRGTIRYEVSLDHPEKHIFHVVMHVPDVSGSVTVQIPAWNALYQIRDFSSHVERLEAFIGEQPARIEKLDKQTWGITGSGTVTVRYDTYWDEPGPFGTQLNKDHAFINPAMILMYVPNRRAEAVHLSLPEIPDAWQAASASLTMLESMGGARNFGFDARSYDDLADAPIEVGKFEEFTLTQDAAEVRVIIHGDNWRRDRVSDVLRRICAYEIKLMDGAPFDHYTFIIHIGKAAYGAGGGMEHVNSTAVSVPSDDFLPGVAAHEFFHLWNVKRIRPATLEPVDYTKEQYTRALWFAEGVTNTYGAYALVRTGLWTKQQFYEDLSDQITELEARPAEHWQSAEQSSLDAWLEKYPLYNRPDHSVSYYTKGQLLGLLLDILIRDHTNNNASLDDVLRLMNREFAAKGRFYRDSLDVRLMAERAADTSFEDFFRRYVAGAEPLPYNQVLPLAGLELRSATRSRAVPGFSLERTPTGDWRVVSIDPDGEAARSGLREGDLILRWNDGDVPRRLERWLREQKPGDKLRLRLRREDKEQSLEFPLGEVKGTLWQVMESSAAGEKANRIRYGLLRGTSGSENAH